MITIYKYVAIYSFLRYLWRNLRTQVVCGCMLLNKFYLSVQGRLFRMETFCLFSLKGVISIYIWMGKYKPVYHGGHLLPSGLLILSPWPQPPQIFQRDDPLGRSPLWSTSTFPSPTNSASFLQFPC